MRDTSTYETHPLGRMEWIKLYGLLLGKEAEAQAHFLFPVGWIVECHSPCFAVKSQDVFCQDVGLADVLNHISLQSERILVQGNQFLVLQKSKWTLFDGCHIAANE